MNVGMLYEIELLIDRGPYWGFLKNWHVKSKTKQEITADVIAFYLCIQLLDGCHQSVSFYVTTKAASFE